MIARLYRLLLLVPVFALPIFGSPPGPNITLLTPFSGSWAGCEYQEIVFRLSDLDGIDESTIRIRVEGDEYIWPDPTHFSWDGDSSFSFTPDIPFENGLEVNVVFLALEDSDGTPIDDSLSWLFFIDTDKPFCVGSSRVPSPGTIIRDNRPEIRIEVRDTTSGIPLSGLCMCFDSYTYNCPPDRNSGYCWESSPYIEYDDTFFTILTAGLGISFRNEDSVTVRLRKAVDRVPQGEAVCGPNWIDTLDPNLEWTFVIDLLGPKSTLLYPNDGDTIGCDTLVVLLDDFSGVNVPSCKLRLDTQLQSVGTSSYVNGYGDTVYYSGTGTAEIYPEGPITVYVNSVRDVVDNQSTYIGGDHTEWHLVVDKSPPFGIDPMPLDSGVSGEASPNVSVAIVDSISGVNGDSIVFEIDGVDYPMGVAGVAWDGLRASFNTGTAGLSWEDRDTVDVCIRTIDMVRADRCGPNRMNVPFCWSFIVDQGGPIVEIVDPPDESWTACEFQEIYFFLMDPSGIETSTIEFSVGGTTYHGLDHCTYADDTLAFTPDSPFSDGDTVSVLFSHALDSAGTDIDAPVGSEFYIDLTSPEITAISPIPGSIFGAGVDLEWNISDLGSGVAPESTVVSVDGVDYIWPGGFSWDGSTMSFDIEASTGPFEDAGTLDLCIRVADRVDASHCGPNEHDSCFILIYDGLGPTALLDYPEDSVITACADSEVRIVILDNYGVDFSTVQLRIDGVLYGLSDSEISISGDTIIFTPSASFTHLDSVDVVLIDALDFVGNGLIGAPLEWGFIVDSQPPVISSLWPVPGDVIADGSPTVSVNVRDYPSEIDEGYFIVTVDGVSYSWPDAALSWDGVWLNFDFAIAGLAFIDGDTAVFCMNRVADGVSPDYCGPNIADLDSCWSFTFDLTGPTAALLVPLDRAFSACPYQTVVFGIDDENGVVVESCAVRIDGTVHDWPDAALSWAGDSLIFTPPGPFADCDTIELSVIEAVDSVGNSLSGSYDWWFVSDQSAPVLNDVDPPPGSLISEASPTIEIFATDSLSGVDPLSLSISIDGARYAGTLPWIVWSGGKFDIDTDIGGLSWSDGDTISICLDSLADSVPEEYCGPNIAAFDSCFSYFVDLNVPEVELIFPDSAIITACADSAIAIRIFDTWGVFEDSIDLVVDAILHGIAEPEMEYSGEILSYLPMGGFSHGDTVEFTVSRVVDLAGNVFLDGPTWFFTVDIEPPELVSISPSPDSVLSDLSTVFEFGFTDDIAGVDEGSIELTLDGTIFAITDAGVSWDAGSGILTFDSGVSGFVFSDSVDICFSASDRVEMAFCGPNSTDSCFQYTFDLNGPEAVPIDPSPGEFSACAFLNITILLTDYSGVDDASIILTIDGVHYTTADTELRYIGDSLLIFEPSSAWSDGTVDVSLYAADVLGNEIDGGDLVYIFYIDLTPPDISGFAPPSGGFATDVSPIISFNIVDDGAGVDAGSVELVVEADTFRVGDTGVSWDGVTLNLDAAFAGIAFADGDDVRCCAAAFDSPDSCGPNFAGPECWDFHVDLGGPVAELIWPPDESTVSCADESILVRLTDPAGVDFDSLIFTLSGTEFTISDDEIDPIDDSTFRFIPGDLFDDGEVVIFSVTRATDAIGNVSGPSETWRFMVDLSPPEADDFYPAPMSISTGDSIGLSLLDAVSGVDPATISLDISGIGIFEIADPALSFSSPILSFDPALAGISFVDGDTVAVCLSAADMPDICPPNLLSSECWSFVVDAGKPVVELLRPAPETITSCGDLGVAFTISDISGIDDSSLRFSFDGVEFGSTDDGILWDEPILKFTPSAVYTHYDTIRAALIGAADILGNAMDIADSVWTYFIVDTRPPTVDYPFPTAGSTVADPYQPISIWAFDFPAGIDRESAVIEVRGVDYDYPSPGLSWSGDELRFDPEDAGIIFADGESITVCLSELSDDVDTCDANELIEPFCWEFEIDLTGPMARIVLPLPNRWVACGPGEQSIEMIIRDDEDVVPASIRFLVDGIEYGVASPQLSFSDSILTFVPSTAWMDGDTVFAGLIDAEDTLGNPLPSPLEWHFYVDLSAPVTGGYYPSDGAVVGSVDYIELSIFDLGCGLDDSSVVLEIDGFYYSLGSGLELFGDNFILDGDGILSEPSGSVDICLVEALDLPDYCAANDISMPFCWSIFVDNAIPDAWPINPQNGDYVACDSTEQYLVVYLHDDFGILADSIEISVNGVSHRFTGGGMSFGDTMLTYIPPEPWEDGDTINVHIISAPDSFGNPIEPISYYFYMDLSPPEIYSISPESGDTISSVGGSAIRAGLTDRLSGLDVSSVYFVVDGEDYFVGDIPGPIWIPAESTAVLELSGLGVDFDHGTTVEICVGASDMPDWCDPNEAMECFDYFIDDEPPMALLESPDRDSACTSCRLQGFRALISDASMIDDTTFIFRVNGKIYTADSAGVTFSAIDRRIYFVPSEPWENGDTVHLDSFCVSDIYGNVGYNLIEFYSYIDLEPPVVFGMEPPDGGVATRSSPEIRFIIADSGCGLNASTIRFTVDGELLSLDSSGVHYLLPDTILFDTGEHDLSYDDGDTVDVCVVGASDEALYCGTNWLPAPICWWFTINTAGPMAEIVTPDSGEWIACDSSDQEILIFLADPDGVNPTSVSLVVDGIDYTIDSVGLVYNRPTSMLRFVPSEPWGDGDTIGVLLRSAEDSLGNGLALPVEFEFYVDLSPPETTFVHPVVGLAIHPGPAHISVGIEDRGAGIVDGSLGIGIGGVWHDVGSAGVLWDGDSLMFDGSVSGDTIFAGDTVLICVRGEDSTSLCGPNEMLVCWDYITTSNGPYAEPRFPAMGAVTSCTDTGVHIFVFDSDGDIIVPHSFVTVIDDTFVVHGTAWPDIFYDYDDTTLYINVGPHEHGDTVHVDIIGAMDIFHSPLTSPLELWFVIDTIGPKVISGWPPLGGMIAPGSPDMSFYCDDFPAGIDHGFGEISIWGHDYDLGSGVLWNGDTIVLPGAVYSADTSLQDGDSVLITITLYDSAQYCGANVSVVEWWFNVGVTPPEAEILSPQNGAVTSCDGGGIRILVTDDDGLCYDSCGVVIDDEVHYPSDPNLYFNVDTMIYNAPGVFDHGDTITFWPVAEDIYGAELAEADTFTFIVDIEPPVGSDEQPPDGAEILDWQAGVDIAIVDIPAGVNSSTLSMTLTTPRWTRIFAPGSLSVYWDGSRFGIDVAGYNGGVDWEPVLDGSLIFWHERETVSVEVYIADTACCCGANDTTYSWSFYILDDDTIGPVFSVFSPIEFWSGIASDVHASISDPSGVFDDATGPGGQGVYLTWDSDGSIIDGGESTVQMDLVSGDEFATVTPIGPFYAGDSPVFRISAYDNDFDFEIIEDRTKSISGTIRPELIIGQGPVAGLLFPAHRSYSSCDSGEIVLLLTDPETVVDSSILLMVNYDTAVIGSNMIYRNDSLIYNITDPLDDGELVTIRLVEAEDSMGYGLDSAYIWHYWVDTSPPNITVHDYLPLVPPNREALIEWRIVDFGAGIDESVVFIYIDSDTLRLPAIGAAFDGEFLTFDPEAAGYDLSESVAICASACDLAEYCGANCSEPVCVTVRRSKETVCDVWPIPFTPNADGANDFVWFEYPSMELLPATVEIYDIDGRRVFSSDFPATSPEGNAFWDGLRSAGSRARPGTYLYVVLRGGDVICKGTLLLVR